MGRLCCFNRLFGCQELVIGLIGITTTRAGLSHRPSTAVAFVRTIPISYEHEPVK